MSTSLQCKNETSARATVWASPPLRAFLECGPTNGWLWLKGLRASVGGW